MIPLADRIAGAPISWGVDGSPGWGHLLSSDRVLEEMAHIGLSATELGPDGFLGDTPEEARERASSVGLSVVGGFVPLLLHLAETRRQAAYASRAIKTLSTCGSQVLVLGAVLDRRGYDRSASLSDAHWETFDRNLKRLVAQAGEEGLEVALHQHWGMAVEKPQHLERVLANTDVSLCLDTGHMFLAGIDPLEVARSVPDRVAHVHLKDVEDSAASRVRAGEVPFREAVKSGLFQPLGAGDVDIRAVVTALENAGYQGWYVIEQDKVLLQSPPLGRGPVEDASISVAFLRDLARLVEDPSETNGSPTN